MYVGIDVSMGTAEVELYPDVAERMFRNFPVRKVRESNSGNGIWLYTIESELLRPGYHGSVNAILEEGRLRFRRDVDT